MSEKKYNIGKALHRMTAKATDTVSSKITLINNKTLEGKLKSISDYMVEIQILDKKSRSTNYVVPLNSILYISDCDLVK
ncbi:MAG: hypothetical protein ISR65_09520 [Bacteriovoracaceae bacterium]|nr:hypothetical protein [Bacteriovoracaceae bacterium]